MTYTDQELRLSEVIQLLEGIKAERGDLKLTPCIQVLPLNKVARVPWSLFEQDDHNDRVFMSLMLAAETSGAILSMLGEALDESAAAKVAQFTPPGQEQMN